MTDRKVLLCIGYGYSAKALAARLPRAEWRVVGVTRSAENFGAIRAEGAEPMLFPPTAEVVAEAEAILISAGPRAEGDPTLNAVGAEIAGDTPRWVGYLSTTGVYGDQKGGWVDEATPLNPSTIRGQWRKEAEAAWGALGLPLHIFRLAGIYGPGRGPFSKLRKGVARRIYKEGQVFSRIHRDDIGAALAASLARPCPGAIYNLCDDLPAPPQDVLAFAAELLDMTPPPLTPIEEVEMTPMAASFYSESKRISNRRLREDLGVALRHPTYREGLRAILAEETR